MASSKEATSTFPGDQQTVFAAVCTAVQAEGMTITAADEASGTVHTSVGMTMASWGENATISVVGDPAGTTTVTARSALKFGFGGGRKNQKNVDGLMSRVSQVLEGS